MAKREEEDSPWAIIIRMAPFHPRDELDIIPAVKIPICPTEE